MSTLLARGQQPVAKSNDARPVWMEKPSRLGSGAKAVLLTLITVAVVFPFLTVVSTSIASEQQIVEAGGYVLFPTDPTLAAYKAIFSGGVVTKSILVSVGVTLAGTALSLLTTISLAYALSKRGVLGGRIVLMGVLFTLLFAPGLIPTYLMVKSLGLIDSYWSLILPGLLSAFNLVVMRAFFMNIPQELIDSARIDGAGDLGILIRIVLPLSKAVVAVVGLFYAVGYWNAWFNALIYLNDSSKWPVQMILRTYVLQGQSLAADQLGVERVPPPQSIQMAVVMVALVPILCVYPFLQKYFTKGVLTGAIKG
jgi:putative aldouronate transport system permease protein